MHGRELWSSDGTVAGTVLAQDIASAGSSSDPAKPTVSGDRLYFAANGNGAFWGLVAGMGSVFGISLVTEIAYLWFNVIGTVAVLVVGVVVSAMTGGRDGGRTASA